MTDLDRAAELLRTASTVAVVPGFGLAAARSQHELALLLDALPAEVILVVHPLAGRFPGHLDAVLDQAGIPVRSRTDRLPPSVDVVLAVGASDLLDPTAVPTGIDPGPARLIMITDPAHPTFSGHAPTITPDVFLPGGVRRVLAELHGAVAEYA